MTEKEILKAIEKGRNLKLIADQMGITWRMLYYRMRGNSKLKPWPKYEKAYKKRMEYIQKIKGI